MSGTSRVVSSGASAATPFTCSRSSVGSKAAADPKDFQTRLDLAMAYWAGEKRKEAIDELLAMIKADRKWNEEAARQQLLKFFEALGFTDPLAVDGRKRLSTILFS